MRVLGSFAFSQVLSKALKKTPRVGVGGRELHSIHGVAHVGTTTTVTKTHTLTVKYTLRIRHVGPVPYLS